MSSLLGTAVDLTQPQHQALSSASVNLSSLLSTLQAEGVVNGANTALTQPLSVSQLATGIGDTLKAAGNTNAANAAYALAAQTTAVSGQQTLTSILSGEKSATVLNQSNVNALDLLDAVVSTNNLNTSRPIQSVNTTGAALGLNANLGAITLAVAVMDQAVFVCGPTGSKFYSASLRLRVHAGLSNAGLNLDLGLAAVNISLSSLDIIAAVGRASGTLKSINAVSNAIGVEVTPGVAELYLGTVSDQVLQDRNARLDQVASLGYATLASVSVNLLGLLTTASVDARAYASGNAPVPTLLSFTGPYPQTKSATTSSTFVTNLLNTLLGSLDLRVNAFVGPLDLGTLLSGVIGLVVSTLKSTTGLLSTLLNSLLAGAVDPLLSGLGLGLGRVDVTVDRTFAIPPGSACDDGQFCTENHICGPNSVCTGTPKSCDDGLDCTTEMCDEANDRCNTSSTSGCVINKTCFANGANNPSNTCQACVPGTSISGWTNKSIGTSCNDNKYCTVDDACDAAGSCVGSARSCDDSLGCTLDGCDDAAGKCTNLLTIGCAISGACWLPGANNPDNACQSCVPTASPNSWTNKTAGIPCSDGLFCTVDDQCDGAGNCTSSARDCSDGKACTLDACNEAQQRCTSSLSGGCMIAGQCVGAGVPNPFNFCQECNPALSTMSFSNKSDGTSCNDNLYCTAVDACSGGVCLGAARDCTDALGCTTEFCDEVNDRCGILLQTGCVIDGMCVPAGADNPANPCQSCNTALAVNAWSNKLLGASCSDGLYCTVDDACDGNGQCSGSARDCGTGQGCSAGVCDEDMDMCGAVTPGCLIANTCYPAGTTNPQDQCQVCTPSKSNTAWSLKDNGASCSDGLFCTEGDTCLAGVCTGGAAKSCPHDLFDCTVEVCNELTHCDALVQGSCLIDGLCIGAEQLNPDNPCQRCDPMTSTSSWTALAENATCADGLFCTDNDKCVAGICTGTPLSCASSFGCATGTCNEAQNRCDTIISGCLIGSACYVALQANPMNPCEVCDPGQAQDRWSPKAQGALCSDGKFCTVDDACDGAGRCATRARSCADALGCTTDMCNETAKACESTPLAACVIGNGCIDSNTINPDNACQQCLPGSSLAAWSLRPVGSACSDGRGCTSDDKCQVDGVCLGSLLQCNDGLNCTSELCEETTGTCKSTVVSGCAIGGACYARGAADPDNPCRACDPDSAIDGWTNKPADAACDDGKYCTLDLCNGAGDCVSTARDCNDNLGCTQDRCDEDGDRCVSTAADSCVIDGQCYARSKDNPNNDCQACNPDVNDAGWSNKNVGAGCTGGVFCLVGRACNEVGLCSGGTARDCSDGAACSTDACNEVDGCTHINADGCVVDGSCIALGALKPNDPCQFCDPNRNALGWSPLRSDYCT